MDCKETCVIKSDSSEQLMKLHSEELTKLRKLRLVVKQLKGIDCEKLEIHDKDQLREAIELIKVGEYLYLNEEKNTVMNLDEEISINLNYSERKALRHLLGMSLERELQRINNFILKLRTELPEIFADSNSLQSQILLLEEERRNNMEKLIKLRNRKCNFLYTAAEMKVGPYLGNELELMLTKSLENQQKISLLRGYFVKELLTSTEHNLKAIREVEGYINSAIEMEKDSSK